MHQTWNLVPLVVASRDLPAGAELTMEDVSQRSVPEQFVPSTAIKPDAASKAIGQRLGRPVVAGDALTWPDVEARLSSTVVKRGRAMPVELDVGDTIVAQDHVDVLTVAADDEGPWAKTVLQNVIVLRVEPSSKGPTWRRLWLMLIPEEAELLLVAEEHGHFKVTLRNPDDIDMAESRGVTRLTPESDPRRLIVRCNLHAPIEIIRGIAAKATGKAAN